MPYIETKFRIKQEYFDNYGYVPPKMKERGIDQIYRGKYETEYKHAYIQRSPKSKHTRYYINDRFRYLHEVGKKQTVIITL